MNVRSIILVLAALLVAGGTAFVARGLLTGPRQEPVQVQQEQPAKKVLVAKVNLPAGSFIKDEDITWQKWPTDGVNEAYMVEGQNDTGTVVGAVVRRGIVAGSPITEAQFARPGDRGFLAAVLTPGMRAVTITVNEATSVAGLIFPGDRTDLLLLQSLPSDGSGGSETGTYAPHAAETFLENVRILATERTLNDIDGEAKKIDNVTIEVTPKQAEMLAAIRDLGTLSLSLRSLAKPEPGASGPQVASAAASAPVTGMAFLNETVAAAAVPSSSTSSSSSVPTASDIERDDPPASGTTSTLDVDVSRPLASRVLSKGVQLVKGSTNGVSVETVNAR
jgi:pilus assembly protein CpaB